MTEYWKSQDKKYCDVCKCWLTDNPTSIQIHENGVRHKMNSQEKLRDIQKKAKSQDKDDKKLAKTMRQIEQAAAAAAALDKESNPDMSLKIQSYMDFMKEKEISLGGGTVETNIVEKAPKVNILHREETSAKDAFEEPTVKPYTSRFGGWTSIESSGPKLDLELPSSGYSVSAGKAKKKKASSSTSIISAAATVTAPSSINFTAKFKEKKKHVFTEKVVPVTASISTTSTIKPEPVGSEVAFKKRKFTRPNARQPIDD